ncbi:MAG TPA: winged helix-turn-helix domain-containing protein, partial [Candidatus Wallbacteria bacterium]|nr:winged helix-turn-helix domain-containing protein [Candidatus Wallbacteria bacterium]
GKGWRHLNDNGATGFKQLKSVIFEKEPAAMESEKLSMAIGWLLKESKINVIESGTGKGYRITFELKK